MFRRELRNYAPRVPGGLIALTENGYFLVKGNKRFKFNSTRALNTWNLKVVKTTELAMRDVKNAGLVGFRDGSLIRDISNNKIYLVSDYKKYLISNPDTLTVLGFKFNDILLVSSSEAELHPYGGILNA